MLSFKTRRSTKVTDIQIFIRLMGWMPYKDIKLLMLEEKKKTFTTIKEVSYDRYHIL